MANMDRVNAILDYIEAHPEQWRQEAFQDKYACNTTYCFAGHAILLFGSEDGYRIGFEQFSEYDPIYVKDFNGIERRSDWETAAAKILDLSNTEIELIFYFMVNDFPMFKEHVLNVLGESND